MSAAAAGIARAQLAADRARAAAAAAAAATAAPPISDAHNSDLFGGDSAEHTNQGRGGGSANAPDGSLSTTPTGTAKGALSPTRLTEAALRRHLAAASPFAAGGGGGSFAGPVSPKGGSGRSPPAGGPSARYDPAALPFHCAADYFNSGGGGGGGAVVQRV
jgi:hypothetical protein